MDIQDLVKKLSQPRFLRSLVGFLVRHADLVERVKSLENQLKTFNKHLASLESGGKSPGQSTDQKNTSASPKSKDSIYEWVKDLSHSDWYDLLLESSEVANPSGLAMPGFPAESIQKSIVGASNRDAIAQIQGFYNKFHEYAVSFDNPVLPEKKILDFGSGWGRIYRFFIKDFLPGNLVGVDLDKKFIDMCRDLIPYGNFQLISGHPPLKFDKGNFDYIVSYSVFSHLAKPIADSWITEFARLLSKGGILYITVFGRRHIEGFVAHYNNARKESPDLPELSLTDFYRMHDDGEYIYSPSGGGGVRTKDIYGWTVVGPEYVKKNWCKEFDLVDLIDDADVCRQNILVLKKK